MSPPNPPKVILFDVGGVCVLSPFQGILEFEQKHNIPKDWVNFAISRSAPNGSWQRLERGEIKMDAEFFKGFNADLQNEEIWKEFHTSNKNGQRKLKDLANPTQLGDPISLKAETADSMPTEDDRGAQSTSPGSTKDNSRAQTENTPRPTLSKLAKDTTIGDPISLESEEVVNPVEDKPHNKIPPPQPTPTRSSPTTTSPSSSTTPNLPPIPPIDAESLFWAMMTASRHPDPYVFPALQHLKKLSPRFIIGALTNTVIYPPDHPWSTLPISSASSTSSSSSTSTARGNQQRSAYFFDPASLFDVYISSAEVGMRKPEREIYELAIQRLSDFDKEIRGGPGVKAEDILFLDDIGQNLSMAREVGMRTIKVQLGKTWRAVKELEKEAGVELMDEKTRRSKL